jgi:hypothetical protein
MANIRISGPIDETDPTRPVVPLSTAPGNIWRMAVNDYVAWAKETGPTPRGLPTEPHSPKSAMPITFNVVGPQIRLTLEAGATFAIVSRFVREVIGYANAQAP